MKIGVFDSGIGGLSVAQAIERSLPSHEVIFVNDVQNVPYGNKSPTQLLELVQPILQELVHQGCHVIVIACNTVTTTIIDSLRDRIPVPLIGMEPMIKPAADQTSSGIIAVCATPGTLASDRYAFLKNHYAENKTIIEPDCSDWASLIESNDINDQRIRACITPALEQGADVIVLGCTHYHWIEADIQEIASSYGARVLQPEIPVIEQLTRVLKQLP